MRKTPVEIESALAEYLADNPEVTAQQLPDDGIFPNSKLPLLLFRKALCAPEEHAAAIFEQLFTANDWRGSWRNGIYDYHHYHSTTHEVLGVFRGSAKVQLGGEKGMVYDVSPGDVIVIPAGVAHKNLGSSADFGIVGAYPEGRKWDMNYGKPGERPRADRTIAQVPLPAKDPLYGPAGPLFDHWK